MWAAWNNSTTYRHHTIGLCDFTVPTRPDQLNVFSVADFKVQSAATWVVTMASGSYSTHARMLAQNNILSSSCIAMCGFKQMFAQFCCRYDRKEEERERKDCGAEGMGKEMMYNQCSYRWWGQRCGKGNDVQSVFIQMVGPKVSEGKCCTVFIQMTGKGNAVQCSYR